MSSAEACDRLQIRPQTLYAYVSRGLLHPRKEARRSWFDIAELDQLAAKGRRATRSGRLEVLIDTGITLLDPAGQLSYRGVDTSAIAGRWSFERTAEWLWTGRDDGEPASWPLAADTEVAGARPGDRLRVAAATMAASATDEDRQLEAAASIGRRLVPGLIASLPLLGEPSSSGIAARLWPRLTARPATGSGVRALDAALVLLADHELAASTIAARVAASVWSPPLDVVVSAMAAHAGVLHGGASADIEAGLRAGRAADAAFGHTVYRAGDPRATALLPFVRSAAGTTRWRPIEQAIRGRPGPNIDLALAALVVGTDMVPGAGTAIFAIARTAGWLAHAAEEYERALRFRPRASYTGILPAGR